MPVSALFDFPCNSYLMVRLDYVLICGDELEAKIMRIVEQYMQDERKAIYRNILNDPKSSVTPDEMVDVTRDIWVPISHRLFKNDLYDPDLSENTLKRRLKALRSKGFLKINDTGLGKYEAPKYQIDAELVQKEFDLLKKMGKVAYQKLMASKFDPIKISSHQNLTPAGHQNLIPSSDLRGSNFDGNSRKIYEVEERVEGDGDFADAASPAPATFSVSPEDPQQALPIAGGTTTPSSPSIPSQLSARAIMRTLGTGTIPVAPAAASPEDTVKKCKAHTWAQAVQDLIGEAPLIVTYCVNCGYWKEKPEVLLAQRRANDYMKVTDRAQEASVESEVHAPSVAHSLAGAYRGQSARVAPIVESARVPAGAEPSAGRGTLGSRELDHDPVPGRGRSGGKSGKAGGTNARQTAKAQDAGVKPRAKKETAPVEEIVLSPHARMVFEAWCSQFHVEVKLGKANAKAAEFFVHPAKVWCRELKLSLPEFLKAIYDWVWEADKTKGYYKTRGVKLFDMEREFEGWQSAKQRELEEAAKKAQPNIPGKQRATVSGLPRFE